MLKEFKEFAMRGSVVDLASGVVIGAAFGKIVSSFVADIINPIIGVLKVKVMLSKKLKYLSPDLPSPLGFVVLKKSPVTRAFPLLTP